MKRVLVVGGAGYVGGALISRLLQTEHQLRVYDNLLYEDSYRQPVEFVFGDVRDWDQLQPHLEWADVVVWLAALVGDGACALDPELATEVNERSVGRLAESFGGRIIFTSTCSVLGAQDGLLTEESRLNPLSHYAVTKVGAEGHLRGKKALVFRLGTLFGVGDRFSRIRLDLVVNVLTVKACLYRRISVFGGAQYRPLLHVQDVAEAIAANIETPHVGLFNLHAVNVRIMDLAEILRKHFPDLEVLRTEVKFQDSRNYMVSSDRARAAFAFNPRHTVDDGIRELKELIEAGRLKNLGVPRHSNHRFLKDILSRPSSPLGYEVPAGF